MPRRTDARHPARRVSAREAWEAGKIEGSVGGIKETIRNYVVSFQDRASASVKSFHKQ
jgi:hypothetical protein